MIGAASATAGVLALIIAGLFIWKKAAPKVSAVLLLVAGAGIGGAIGRFLSGGANAVEGFADRLVGSAAGGTVSGVVAMVLAFIVVWDLWPKHKANRVTQGAAFALPIFGLGNGGVVGTAFGAVISAVSTALLALANFL